MSEKEPFDLEADPFNTGFQAKEEIITDDVVKFVKDRRGFFPKDEPLTDPAFWLANTKAAIKNGWFAAPDWKVNDPHKWPLSQTKWLSDWVMAKYEDMQKVPFD